MTNSRAGKNETWYLGAINIANFTEDVYANFATITTPSTNTVETVLQYAITLKFMDVNIQTNAVSGNTIISFQDDGATVGSTITVTGSTTGYFASAASSVLILKGSLINLLLDFSTGSGNFEISSGSAHIK